MGLLPGAKYGLCAWCKVRAVCVVKVDGVNNRTTTFVSIEMQGSGESLSLYLLYTTGYILASTPWPGIILMLRLCLAAVLTGHHRKILSAAFSLYLKGYCHRDFLTLFGRAISLRYYADTVFAFSVILPVLCFDTSSYCFYVGKQK